ncbi:MAG: hypothetical protein ABIJ37_02670 [Pseudomonadota bacterium]
MIEGAYANKVDFMEETCLRTSRFTEFLIRENGLDESGFKEWVFCPGMLFNSTDKWWGGQGKRDKPHEGLDLCFYRDKEETVLHLGKKTKVPVIYDGIIVGIAEDFLGKSVIIEHLFPDCNNKRLCAIYGHTIPEDNIYIGKFVQEGDIIASLADSNRLKTDILPHLHISLGWASEVVSYERLNWGNIDNPNTLTLMDPLKVIELQYLIFENEDCKKLGRQMFYL